MFDSVKKCGKIVSCMIVVLCREGDVPLCAEDTGKGEKVYGTVMGRPFHKRNGSAGI